MERDSERSEQRIGLTSDARVPADEPRPTADPSTLKLSMDYAWNWFSLHADHRMRAVHFFLLTSAFLVAGFGAAMTSQHRGVAVGIGGAGATLAVLFLLFEIRIRELLKAGEDALKPLESLLAMAQSIDTLKIATRVDTPRAIIKTRLELGESLERNKASHASRISLSGSL